LTKGTPVFHLTPSTIARYFFQDFARYLRYRVARGAERVSATAFRIRLE
jgi:hypothetical protein